MSGTRCNAYEQKPDEELPGVYTHPARHKQNWHPYTQMTSTHCALGWWNMAAMLQSYNRLPQRSCFSRLMGLMWPQAWFGGAACNATLNLSLITGVALLQSTELNLKKKILYHCLQTFCCHWVLGFWIKTSVANVLLHVLPNTNQETVVSKRHSICLHGLQSTQCVSGWFLPT